MHACGVAELLESDRVDLPGQRERAVGVRHARLAGAYRPRPFDAAPPRPIDRSEREPLLDELRTEGRRVLAAAGTAAEAVRFRYGVDARYAGQGNEVTSGSAKVTAWPLDDADVLDAFEREYRRIYGLTIPDVPVEVVTWRLAVSRRRRSGRSRSGGRRPGAEPFGTRPVVFGRAQDPVDTPVYRRGDLGGGRPLRRAGHRRGTRDHRRDPTRMERRGRRRRQSRRHQSRPPRDERSNVMTDTIESPGR